MEKTGFGRMLSLLLAVSVLCSCSGQGTLPPQSSQPPQDSQPSQNVPSSGVQPRAAFPAEASSRVTGGRLTILASVNEDVVREVVARFSQETGCEVSFACVPAVQAQELLLGDFGQTDVFWGATADIHKQLGDRGRLLRNLGGGEAVGRFYQDQSGEWQPVSVEILSIGVNREALTRRLGEGVPLPETLEELASPAYAGLLVLADPNTSYSGTLLASSILRTYGEEGGLAILEALWHNAGEFAQTDLVAAQKVGIGVYPVTVGYYSDQLRVLRAGFPLEAAVYPGAGWSVAPVSILAAGPNGTEARAFRAFLHAPEIQELMGALNQSISPREDILLSERLNVTVLDFPVSSPARVNTSYAKDAAIRDLFHQFKEESTGIIFADERQPSLPAEESLE